MTDKNAEKTNNTVDFRAFAPFFTLCPCRTCAHRKKSLLASADGSVVACARYNPATCKGCPVAHAMPKGAA